MRMHIYHLLTWRQQKDNYFTQGPTKSDYFVSIKTVKVRSHSVVMHEVTFKPSIFLMINAAYLLDQQNLMWNQHGEIFNQLRRFLLIWLDFAHENVAKFHKQNFSTVNSVAMYKDTFKPSIFCQTTGNSCDQLKV